MKNFFMFLILSTLICNTMNAEGGLSVNWGVNFTHPSAPSPYGYKTGAGAQLGCSYSLNLFSRFSIAPGIKISYNTWKFDSFDYVELGNINIEKVDHGFREWEMSVPLSLSYTIPIRNANLMLLSGPQINYGLSNKLFTTIIVDGRDIGNTCNMYSDGTSGLMYKRFSTSWNFGLNLSFAKHYIIGVNSSIGLSNIAKSASYEIRKNSYSVTFGYSF